MSTTRFSRRVYSPAFHSLNLLSTWCIPSPRFMFTYIIRPSRLGNVLCNSSMQSKEYWILFKKKGYNHHFMIMSHNETIHVGVILIFVPVKRPFVWFLSFFRFLYNSIFSFFPMQVFSLFSQRPSIFAPQFPPVPIQSLSLSLFIPRQEQVF